MYSDKKKSKFCVGSLVTAPNGLPNEWCGDWTLARKPCEVTVQFDSEELLELDVFSTCGSERTYKILKVWLREELSVNGNRLEFYYELEGGNGARIREEFFAGKNCGCEIPIERNGWRVSEIYKINYNTYAAIAPYDAVKVSKTEHCKGYLGITSDNVRKTSTGQRPFVGEFLTYVVGAWYSADVVEFEFDCRGFKNSPLQLDRIKCSITVVDGKIDFSKCRLESWSPYGAFIINAIRDSKTSKISSGTMVAVDEFMQNITIVDAERLNSDIREVFSF